jgi:hypothetical protein
MARRNGCDGKRRHATLLTAQIACRRSKNCSLHPYCCDKCGGFHVGHSNNAFLRAKRIDQLIARSERSRVATNEGER